MKITATSDIHGFCFTPYNNEGDVFCFCGDIVPLKIQNDNNLSEYWIKNHFLVMCNKLKYKHIIFIAGNHDFILERKDLSYLWESFPNIHYLCDSKIIIDGVSFYGFPWGLYEDKWAFHKFNGEMYDKCKEIEDCDILLTHCPPKIGTQGTVLDNKLYNYMTDYGNGYLTNRLLDLNYKYVLSGHIHSGNHNIDMLENTKCINVSMCNEKYHAICEPYTFEI